MRGVIVFVVGVLSVFITDARIYPQQISSSSSLVAKGLQNISIVPKPAEMSAGEGKFTIERGMSLIADDGAKPVAEYLAGALTPVLHERPEVVEPLSSDKISSHKGVVFLKVDTQYKDTNPESYRLKIDKNAIRITGSTPAGVFYACQTLRQLLPAEAFTQHSARRTRWAVACVDIEDRPRFAWRGLLLDVARHFRSKEEIKKIIDLLAFYKINRLQLHLTDDQGWRVEIKKYPKLTEVGAWRKGSDGKPYGGFYSQNDIRELVAYAAERFVTIVPEIEMPGHATAAVAAYPWISCRGVPVDVETGWGVFPNLYCAGNDKSFDFIEDVLAEVLELFPSKYIHIGGDEARKTYWKLCPKCQARIEAEGLKDEHELQSYFVKRIEQFLRSKSRVLIAGTKSSKAGWRLAPL